MLCCVHGLQCAAALCPSLATGGASVLTAAPPKCLPLAPSARSDTDGNVLETTNAVIAHALKQRTKDDVTGAC